MRLFALSLLTLLLVPATAAGKDLSAPVRVLWNSTPEDIRAGGSWDARVSVLQGPGALHEGHAQPAIVVTDLARHTERRVPMSIDVPPDTFRATVTFPRAGLYEVAVAGFDPRDPERFTDIGPPVRIEPARSGNAASWPWAPTAGAIAVLLASAWSVRRLGAQGATNGRSSAAWRGWRKTSSTIGRKNSSGSES